MNIKKNIIGLTLAFIMVASIFTVLPVAADGPTPPSGADNPLIPVEDPYYVSSLRVYGECDEGYMGMDYDEKGQFAYVNMTDPFDPTVLYKDSITFDPALIIEADYDMMSADSHNVFEKAFLRLWYEPEHQYTKPAYIHPTIEVETTYMLVDASGTSDNEPWPGSANTTYFVFPIVELPLGQTGLGDVENNVTGDRANMVDLVLVEGTTAPNGTTPQGKIAIEKGYTLEAGDTIQFLDHKLRLDYVVERDGVKFAKVTMWYAGNMADDTRVRLLLGEYDDGSPDAPRDNTYFKRHNERYSTPSHTYPAFRTWYARFDAPVGDTGAEIYVGMELAANDTFYVNGVRYDVPAVGVVDTNGDDVADKYKYITLRTPLPKAEDGEQVPDDGKASSQWLDTIRVTEQIPLLPPFNVEHRIVEDINYYGTESPADRTLDVPALAFCYVEEDIDERYSTDLLEVLNEVNRYNQSLPPFENWTKEDIQTRPDQYTAFALPWNGTTPSPDPGEPWYYLLTTSFYAPNSINLSTLSSPGGIPRAAFVHDARPGYEQDIYVNFPGAGIDGNLSVRVYGEDDIGPYPEYAALGGGLFHYEDYTQPFDPAAIRKDSITFNPAILQWNAANYPMSADSENIDLKKYLRIWYEPEHNYSKPNPDYPDTYYTYPTIEVETTYLLIDRQDKLPITGSGNTTFFAFPIVADPDTEQPGLDLFENPNMGEQATRENVVTLQYVYGTVDPYWKTVYDNATIRIQKTYTLNLDDRVDFMDIGLQLEDLGMTGASVRLFALRNNNDGAHFGQNAGQSLPYYERRYVDSESLDDFADVRYPDRTWYAVVEDRDPSETNKSWATITVGKELRAGDVFYVDGVRYDIVAIEVVDTDGDGVADEFKYITLKTPLPKCVEELELQYDPFPELPDDGIISSTWIVCVPPEEPIPLNPPFNMEHQIVDDIDVPLWEPTAHIAEWPIGNPAGVYGSTYFPWGERYVTMQHPEEDIYCGLYNGSTWVSYFVAVQVNTNPADPNDQGWIAYDVKERIIPEFYAPLEVIWVDETYEPRYTTNLWEILNETITGDEPPLEDWFRFDIYTRPDQYTEFVLPPDKERWNFTSNRWRTRLHNDYLITTSFLAPNAEGTLYDLAYNESRRAAFVFDAIETSGIYVNELTDTGLPWPGNNTPNVMVILDNTSVEGCMEVTLTTDGTTHDAWPLLFWVDWDDGTVSEEQLVQNGQFATFVKSYTEAGTYNIKVYAKDIYDKIGVNDTESITVTSDCFVLTFYPGWNAFSVPLTGEPVSTVASESWVSAGQVWQYDWDSEWSVVVAGDFDPDRGYFVYKTTPGTATVVVSGTKAEFNEAAAIFQAGEWNLRGAGWTADTEAYWLYYFFPSTQTYGPTHNVGRGKGYFTKF
ncbi:MAG: hypothetical protein JW878_08735 [Methanomicrobia archaeon]|nr:hypothetical protein [Methanomicrobia archaeon]